jgi:hypothetical protein
MQSPLHESPLLRPVLLSEAPQPLKPKTNAEANHKPMHFMESASNSPLKSRRCLNGFVTRRGRFQLLELSIVVTRSAKASARVVRMISQLARVATR